MATEPIRAGVIGCGNISSAYFKANETFAALNIVACADLEMDRAKAKAEQHNIARACTVKELLSDDDIRIVINLTTPKSHAEVNLAAIEAGKSVHVEKPLAVTREDGKKTLEQARAKGVLVGAAPDTFLGGSHQTCRKIIDDGWIGEPVAATAFMTCRGHEGWHPDPEFYYEVGGGPMFDMGPYYLTALINLLGPVRRLTGSTRTTFPYRTITSEKKFGKKIKVQVPTHVAGVIDFQCGAVGTIITSFDVWSANLPCIEIYGTEGSLFAPDPNSFGGQVFVQRARDEKREMPLTHIYSDNSRGIGAADMAYALQSGRKHRCNGEMAYHVLDLMHAFHDASDAGEHVEVQSTCERPAALPTDLLSGQLDE